MRGRAVSRGRGGERDGGPVGRGRGSTAGRATTAYTADVAQETVTLRLGAAPGATIEVTGTAPDGTELIAGNESSVGNDNGAFASVTLSGLTAGENTIEVAVTAADETTTQGYTLVVTSTGAAAVVDVTLRDLQLSQGPPSPGFMMSALTGQLPEGDVVPSPAFDPGVAAYAMDVAQDTLTIRLRAADGPEIELSGTAADGSGLTGSDGSRVSTSDVFLSQTFSGLTPGENRIEIVLSAGEQEQTYTLAVTYSAAR